MFDTPLNEGIAGAVVIASALILVALLQKPVRCEKCAAKQPKFQQASSTRQAMFGGTTCANCGAELDAKGRVRK